MFLTNNMLKLSKVLKGIPGPLSGGGGEGANEGDSRALQTGKFGCALAGGSHWIGHK